MRLQRRILPVIHSTKTLPLPSLPQEAKRPSYPHKTPSGIQVFTPTSDHREKADAYQAVSLWLNDRWRIAVCHDGRQWIIQYRRTADQWVSRKFFSRAQHVPDVVRFLVDEAAYELALAWAQRIGPHT